MHPRDANDGLPNWRRAHGAAAVCARAKSCPEDFRVTEILDFVPDGSGEHDWLWIEKRDANTAWLARRLAAHAGVAAADVGYAGMKDRVAVTRQWFSVRRPGGARADWSALALPGVTLLEQTRNSRKLRRGAHRGNAFELRLRDVDGAPSERLALIAAQGVPNYFGAQRFGRDGGNLALARALIAGARFKRDKRSLALSAARSYLFNLILERRVAADNWNVLLPGDIANLDGSNSVFAFEAVDDTLLQRCAALDVHPSGALWGRGGDAPGQRILPSEAAAVAAEAQLAAGLERFVAAGRRPLRVAVEELRWEQAADSLLLCFRLRRGAYATAVLRELTRCREAAQDFRSST